jgi:sulfur carrier protein ThiS
MNTKDAKIKFKEHVYNVRTNTTIRRVLKDLNFQPDAHLIIRNGILITDDEMLKDGDTIRLIPVISGG